MSSGETSKNPLSSELLAIRSVLRPSLRPLFSFL